MVSASWLYENAYRWPDICTQSTFRIFPSRSKTSIGSGSFRHSTAPAIVKAIASTAPAWCSARRRTPRMYSLRTSRPRPSSALAPPDCRDPTSTIGQRASLALRVERRTEAILQRRRVAVGGDYDSGLALRRRGGLYAATLSSPLGAPDFVLACVRRASHENPFGQQQQSGMQIANRRQRSDILLRLVILHPDANRDSTAFFNSRSTTIPPVTPSSFAFRPLPTAPASRIDNTTRPESILLVPGSSGRHLAAKAETPRHTLCAVFAAATSRR